MDHHELEQFFMWGTIVGIAVVAISALAWPATRSIAHRVHGKLFGVSPKVVDIVCYAYLALMKASLVLLFLVPWLALLINRPSGE